MSDCSSRTIDSIGSLRPELKNGLLDRQLFCRVAKHVAAIANLSVMCAGPWR